MLDREFLRRVFNTTCSTVFQHVWKSLWVITNVVKPYSS